jgi:hypothetical protein
LPAQVLQSVGGVQDSVHLSLSCQEGAGRRSKLDDLFSCHPVEEVCQQLDILCKIKSP